MEAFRNLLGEKVKVSRGPLGLSGVRKYFTFWLCLRSVVMWLKGPVFFCIKSKVVKFFSKTLLAII